MEARLLDLELPILGTGNNPRSAGLHLTDIIKDLMKASGLEAKRPSNWCFANTINAGFIWEEVLFSYWEKVFGAALARLLARKYDWHQTGEVGRDGIICTPDGIDAHDIITLQEAKFTWKSVNNEPIDNWYYMTQLKSYCKVLNINRALMHIFYCNGDWKGSGPKYRPWEFTFQQHELDENWAMILNHAGLMRERNV